MAANIEQRDLRERVLRAGHGCKDAEPVADAEQKAALAEVPQIS